MGILDIFLQDDETEQPTQKADFYDDVTLNENRFNNRAMMTKNMQTMVGICTGIMADGIVTEDETRFLHHWMMENRDARLFWPGDILFDKLNEVLEDDVVTRDEAKELEILLEQIIGGTLQKTGSTQGQSSTLPLDKDATIIIPDNRFCFTGQFLFGTRKDCHTITEQLGGIAEPRITKKLNYLVIGGLVSNSWANTSYGRKIEKAVEYKRGGSPLSIVSETAWCELLNNN